MLRETYKKLITQKPVSIEEIHMYVAEAWDIFSNKAPYDSSWIHILESTGKLQDLISLITMAISKNPEKVGFYTMSIKNLSTGEIINTYLKNIENGSN